MKKTVIFIIAIIFVIIAGVVIGKNIDKNLDTNKVNSEGLSDTKKEQIKNEVKKQEENKVNNKIEKNENNSIDNTVNTDNNSMEEPKTDKEIALEIVKQDWGENDTTVYFDEEEQTDEGEYIICVREKSTTSAKAWYKVNVDTKTAERWD